MLIGNLLCLSQIAIINSYYFSAGMMLKTWKMNLLPKSRSYDSYANLIPIYHFSFTISQKLIAYSQQLIAKIILLSNPYTIIRRS